MAYTGYTGVFNTTQNPPELNKRSFAQQLVRRFPNGSAPLWGLTSMVKSGRKTAVSSTHAYFAKTMEFVQLTFATAGGTQAGGVTNLVVDSSAGVVPGQVFFNPTTSEIIRVTAVPDSTHVTAVRGQGRIAAANILITDVLINVGTAHAEFSARPTERRLKTVHVPNYTQIFRNAWAVSDTARASLAELGKYNNVAENKQDCALFHSVDMETALIWGQPKMDTSGAQPFHMTQGIIDSIAQYASANIVPAGSTTDQGQLIDMLEVAYQVNTSASDSTMRVGLGGNNAIKVINEIARKSGQMNMTYKDTAFGTSFTQFKFHKGTVNFIEHPLFNQLGAGISDNLLLVDIPAVSLAYMAGRDAFPENFGVGGSHSAGVGIDGVGGSLTSEFAVENLNPMGCAYITGLTAGVAET